MNNAKIKDALQDLTIRLQDAEKGYKKIAENTTNQEIKDWMNKYAAIRHEMHGELEIVSLSYGEMTEVKTSFLGDMHHLFINLKFQFIDRDDLHEEIFDEIERGSSRLIEDYNNVIENVDMPEGLKSMLTHQKKHIEIEIKELRYVMVASA